MIRKRLSFQLTLALFLVAAVPLAGGGAVTYFLLERSISEQVRATHLQLGRASGALVEDYLKDATTKLKSIAQMIRPDENPKAQTQRLNGLIDPPGIFLEVGYWPLRETTVVQAQVQRADYAARNQIPLNNRAFYDNVGQTAYVASKDLPLFAEPALGNVFVAETLEKSVDLTGLPISVPAPERAALTALVDFQPVSQMLARVAGPRRRITLFDRDGKVLSNSGASPEPSATPLVHSMPVAHGGWRIGVEEPRDVALAPLRDATLQATLWFALTCALVIAGAVFFARRLTRPVEALARTAQAIGRGDLSARTGIAREDEIGQLAAEFDRMAAAVQQIDRMKGEFVEHVSHELRTPLTSSKIAIANVQEGLVGTESLHRVQEDLDRLIRMVNELLDAARLEAGIPLAKQSTDLGALVRSSVETLRPLARVALAVSGNGDTLDLDPARVQQIVVNLVDNGLKYAKTRVDVEVRGREVRVTDDGPGVPPEARELIFERFARVESGAKPPGAGLGLSIARKLAELHGGSLACEGSTFILRL